MFDPRPHFPVGPILLGAIALTSLFGCGGEDSASTPERRSSDATVVLSQTFDDRGELAHTVITYGPDQLEVEGELYTAEGATPEGRRVARFLATLSPEELASLAADDLRFDLAVLVTDLLMDLREPEQARARAQLRLEGRGAASLCQALETCAPSPSS